MLKIKDNVDLKELEKFGFEESKSYGGKSYACYSDDGFSVYVYTEDFNDEGEYIGSMKRFILQDGIGYDNFYVPSVIYDLITAGLVEKVEEEVEEEK